MSNRWAALIVCMTLLGGCAQLKVLEPVASVPNSPSTAITAELLVASDLVNALVQIQGLHPETTQLSLISPVPGPDYKFGRALQDVLLAAGYELETVDLPAGEYFVDYLVTKGVDNDASQSTTYQLSVDPVYLKRDYVMEQGRVQPASHLYARGFDASQIALKDEIFSTAPSVEQDAGVISVGSRHPEVAHVEVASASIATDAQSLGTSASIAVPMVNTATEIGPLSEQEPRQALLDLRVNGELKPGRYNEGDQLRFTIKAEYDTQLSCFFRDADRTIMRVYPNRFSSESFLQAGQTLQFPSSKQWSIEATRSGSSDEVMCIEVGPELQSLAQFVESMPDFEPLPVVSFDELLAEVKLATGLTPQTHRMVINVD